MLPPLSRWPVLNDAVLNDALLNDAVLDDAVLNDAVAGLQVAYGPAWEKIQEGLAFLAPHMYFTTLSVCSMSCLSTAFRLSICLPSHQCSTGAATHHLLLLFAPISL